MTAGMAWSTAFTELFGVEHPIAWAPMGGSAGGALAAVVSCGADWDCWVAGTGNGTGRPVSCPSWLGAEDRGVLGS